MELEIIAGLFCVCVLAFLIYMGYVCYLKKYRGYRFDNGIPDVAILRSTSLSHAGMKHFSSAPFRASQINMTQSNERAELLQNSKRPHTFPLSSRVSNLPEIRMEQVV